MDTISDAGRPHGEPARGFGEGEANRARAELEPCTCVMQYWRDAVRARCRVDGKLTYRRRGGRGVVACKAWK